MTITERVDDLITVGQRGEVDVIVHQANLEHTFGAGIARQIRLRLPYAYRADLASAFADPDKLGHFTIGHPDETLGESGPAVVNLYSQTSLYPSHTSYDAMVEGLITLKEWLDVFQEIKSIGFPFQMGSGLADGDWNVVRAIIESVFRDSRFEIVIVRLPDAKRTDPLTDMFVGVAVEAFRTL